MSLLGVVIIVLLKTMQRSSILPWSWTATTGLLVLSYATLSQLSAVLRAGLGAGVKKQWYSWVLHEL